jgi:hypothetical protein
MVALNNLIYRLSLKELPVFKMNIPFTKLLTFNCMILRYSTGTSFFLYTMYISRIQSHILYHGNSLVVSTTIKGGRSANKFRKKKIRKFADLNNLIDLRTFRKCGTLRIFDVWTQPCCDFGT